MPRRRRRTPEAARQAILEAAERHLREVGPQGIRLQEVAADAGLSHPSILHYFGSRRGLVDAVVERAVGGLERDLISALVSGGAPTDTAAILERVGAMLADKGHARLLAWLILSERDGRFGTEHSLQRIAEAVHASRVRDAPDDGPPPEDSVFLVLVAGFALFGDALAGPEMRRSAGLGDDQEAPRRFRTWLAGLLLGHTQRDRPG